MAAANTPDAVASTPRILMTLDAVGGVWRYAMDLAQALTAVGYRFVFAGFGPPPSPAQEAEAAALGELHWFDAPLDWTTEDEAALDVVPAMIASLVAEADIDLVQLNLPSQGMGLEVNVPVLVVSHSCVVTWFAAVRGHAVPEGWQWQERRNRAGFAVADAVLAPSRTHAAMLRQSYGAIPNLSVVYNSARPVMATAEKAPVVFAAGRWWDDGKNGAVLDAAAATTDWPVRMAGPVRGPSGQSVSLSHAQALGELSHKAVMAEMGRAAIVASSSLYEPFGLAPLEAALAGAALVLADIPTYRELWDGTALFADPRRSHEFGQAINRLANDPTLRTQLSHAAGERARQFNPDAQAEAMRAIYDHLLQPHALARMA